MTYYDASAYDFVVVKYSGCKGEIRLIAQYKCTGSLESWGEPAFPATYQQIPESEESGYAVLSLVYYQKSTIHAIAIQPCDNTASITIDEVCFVRSDELWSTVSGTSLNLQPWQWIGETLSTGEYIINKEANTADDSNVTYFDASAYDCVIMKYSSCKGEICLIAQYKCTGALESWGEPMFSATYQLIPESEKSGIIVLSLDPSQKNSIHRISVQPRGNNASIIIDEIYFAKTDDWWAKERPQYAFSISDPVLIDQSTAPWPGYWPDGKISFLPKVDGTGWECYWAEGDSYRTEGYSTYLEEHIANNNWHLIIGKDVDKVEGCNDGGSWMMSVHRLKSGKLVGFFHAESHWDDHFIAYKSIGVTYSSDNGMTWERGKRILATEQPKPETAVWSGLGDGCVVWNEARKQYICYYNSNITGHISMAASSDPEGAPGTWKKWDGQDFTIEGCNSETQLGGKDIPIDGFYAQGGSPSVMWNSYLKKWIMTYGSYSHKIYMSFSDDGIKWDTPWVAFNEDGEQWYPNLISEEGDMFGGKRIRLYYANNFRTYSHRDLVYRILTFENEYLPQTGDGSEASGGSSSLKGDVNNDGVVDIADAVRIVNLIVGKINALARQRQTSLPEPE